MAGPRHPLKHVLACLLGAWLASSALSAAPAGSGMLAQRLAVLFKGGFDGSAEASAGLRATVLADLREAGVFQAVEEALPGAGPMAERPGGEAYLLEMAIRALPTGSALLEATCLVSGQGRPVWKRAFKGRSGALRRVVHRCVDELVGEVAGIPGAADSAFVYSQDVAPGVREVHAIARDGSGDRSLTAFASLTEAPAISRDGRVAVVSYRSGPPQLWAQRVPHGPLDPVRFHSPSNGMGLKDLSWSPDGRRLLFVQENRQGLAGIQTVDPLTASLTSLTAGEHLDFRPTWSPDGKWIAFLSDRTGIPQVHVMDAQGGRIRAVTLDPAPKGAVAWNPRADRIACVSHQNGRFRLLTLAPDGADARDLASWTEAIASIRWSPDGRALLVELAEGPRHRFVIAGLNGQVQPVRGIPGSARAPEWVREMPESLPER